MKDSLAPSPSASAVRKLAMLSDIITPWAIRTAATLRLADLLTDGPRSGADLAAETGADVDALGRLLRHLAYHGLFEEVTPGLFAVTEFGAALSDDHPAGLRPWLDATGAGVRMDRAFSGLPEAVRTGSLAYPAFFGQSFWADLATSPDLSASFDALLAHQSTSFVEEIATTYPWDGIGHLVDVGGGTGSLLAGILRAHPGLRGTLVDLPHVVQDAPQVFAAAGVGDRARTHAGSFFDPLPPGGDVYLLCSVLHDWSDREAAQILRRCLLAAGPNGRVLVSERLIPDLSPLPDAAEPVTAMDLRMLVIAGGRERSLPTFTDLAAHCGAEVASGHRLPSGRTLLELTAARDGAPRGGVTAISA